MEHQVVAALEEAQTGLVSLLQSPERIQKISLAAKMMADVFRREGRVLSIGNGGSMCDAMHFAEELSGRFRENRPALSAIAASDAGFLTCASNDYGYEYAFARFVEAHGRAGDLLLCITTSGSSKNVIEAAKVAQSKGIKVVALTGKDDALIAAHTDLNIATPAGRYADRVQELHIKVIHIFIELVESQLFAEESK